VSGADLQMRDQGAAALGWCCVEICIDVCVNVYWMEKRCTGVRGASCKP